MSAIWLAAVGLVIFGAIILGFTLWILVEAVQKFNYLNSTID